MELKHVDEHIVATVAQLPFIAGNNTFCKLIPLFSLSNSIDKFLNADEFYNDGEIFWRLAPTTNPRLITPGTLMDIQVEPSQDSDSSNPGKSLYQARVVGKEEPISASAGAELFAPPHETSRSLLRLRGSGGEVQLPHVPAKLAYLQVEGFIYGPFSAASAPVADKTIAGKFTLKAAEPNHLYRLRYADFMSRYTPCHKEVSVLLGEKASVQTGWRIKTSYDYLPPEECEKIRDDLASLWEPMDWESLSDKFVRLSGALTTFTRTRTDRQQLTALARQLEQANEAPDLVANLLSAIQGLRKLSEEEEAAFRQLANSLMKAELMTDTRLKKLSEDYLKNYIEHNREQLEASLANLQQEVKNLEAKREEERKRLDRDREMRKSEQKKENEKLQQQLDKLKEKEVEEINAERRRLSEEFAQREKALADERRVIDATLADIRARTEQGAIDCLRMFPFLKALGAGASAPAATVTVERTDAPSRSAVEPFVLPESLHLPSPAARNVVAEMAFLQKLRDYAESEGLSYSHNDLRRFHLSVLCEGLTILEGPSGVGKSSLARLYGDVLAGANATAPRSGTHIVHVSPSWMERADLLGYVNTVTAEFAPSETGLYQQLIFAAEDQRLNADNAGLYPICLDEMNLAQVEHYFSDFMQILEQPEGQRLLRCFSKDSVSRTAVFRDYATVPLVPSVKFIGTVNFDETTRRLSSRLLDRANLIYLSDNVPVRATPARGQIDAGTGVSYGTFAAWRKTAALSEATEKRLAELAEPLRRLGVSVSPRVRMAMARYIASAVPLMGSSENAEAIALDEQLAQRVLSKVRSITSVAQKKALDAVSERLDSFRDAAHSPSRALIERLRAKEHFFGYENEP